MPHPLVQIHCSLKDLGSFIDVWEKAGRDLCAAVYFVNADRNQ